MIRVNEDYFNQLGFGDDIVLFSESGLQIILQQLHAESLVVRLKII